MLAQALSQAWSFLYLTRKARQEHLGVKALSQPGLRALPVATNRSSATDLNKTLLALIYVSYPAHFLIPALSLLCDLE